MKAILFRGKSVETNEWVYGSYILEKYGNTPYICYFEYGTFVNIKQVEVIPETVGEFTGMTDKNGKPIFEGDIVLFCGIKGAVVWKGHKFYVKSNLLLDFSDDDCIEVIGNIHDNP